MNNEMKLTQAFAEIELNNRLAEEEKKRALLEQKAALKKRAPAKKSTKSP